MFNNVLETAIEMAEKIVEFIIRFIINRMLPLYVVVGVDDHSFYGLYLNRKAARKYCRMMRKKYDTKVRYGRVCIVK